MNKRKRFHLLLLATAGLLFAQARVYAFYNPTQGRWLNRDPIGEIGSHLSTDNRQTFVETREDDFSERLNDILNETGGPNLYGFVGNDPFDYTDSLGLLTFKKCSDDQEKELRDQLTIYCGKLKNSLTGCCKNKTILPKLEFMCKNPDITIKCETSKSGSCSGNTCGWSLPGSGTLHMCPDGLGKVGICEDGYGCTLIHEMTHMIGHGGEKWPQQVEKCLGCKHWNGQ